MGNRRNFPARILGGATGNAFLQGIIAIEAIAHSSFALRADGKVWAWGRNNSGQLGDGTTTTRSVPVQVHGLNHIVAIAGAGGTLGEHAIALRSDGTVWAWGRNWNGQLGDGTITTRNTPVQV